MRLLLVCLGGALGSGARYLVAVALARALGPSFPWATFVVNVAWLGYSTFTATGLDVWIFGLYTATVSLFGLYVAKSMSDPSENPNFFIRVQHRF